MISITVITTMLLLMVMITMLRVVSMLTAGEACPVSKPGGGGIVLLSSCKLESCPQ